MLRITVHDHPRAITFQLEGLGNALASFLRKPRAPGAATHPFPGARQRGRRHLSRREAGRVGVATPPGMRSQPP